jgi:hypothetical protein
LGAIVLYGIAVIAIGVAIAIQEKKPIYMVSIPVAYIVQHTCYIIGFWKELIWPRKKKQLGNRRAVFLMDKSESQ